MERGSYSKHASRRDKNMHYEGSRNNHRQQQYQDPQGSGTVNSFGGHQQVQPTVAAPAPPPVFPAGMPHSMPPQIPSGAQTVFSPQPQIDCYHQIHTPPPPPHEVTFYASYGAVAMQPGHVLPPLPQGSVMVPHTATIKMGLQTSANKTIDSNKTKCCRCGFNNTFWEVTLSALERQVQERDKIIDEKDRCIAEMDLKIQHLESELLRLKASPVNSVSVNDVQNDNAVSTDSKIAANNKTQLSQLSADAPEFKCQFTVPVVSANGDISKNAKNVDNKTEDSVENEDSALPRDDDFNNNNCEEQSDDVKVSNTSVAQNDSSSVATQESPSYSRATKMISGDDAKRSEPDRSHLSGAVAKKTRFGKDSRNDLVDYPETKRESSYQQHTRREQFSGPSKYNRHGQSNQSPLERRSTLDRKGTGRSSRDNVRNSVIKEIEGDLFESSDDYSLAHCVGQDFRMGSGIAVEFRKRFKHVTELLSQKVRVGKVAYLEDNGRFIFYLVTKPVSTGKPTLDTLKSAVDDLKQKCLELGVKKLAMPKIGCGLDRLSWHEVKQHLERTFQGNDIDIVVYYINPDWIKKGYKRLKVNYSKKQEYDFSSDDTDQHSLKYGYHHKYDHRYFHYDSYGKQAYTPGAGEREGNQIPYKIGPTPRSANYPLLKIIDEFGKGSTGLVFFGSADGHMDNSGEKLEKRFHFADDFKKAEKSEGTVVKMSKQKELIFALIVKKTEQDEFSFSNFEKCLNRLSAMLKEARYEYIAFEAFEVPTDDVFVHKVLTMCCNHIHKHVSEVWVCWPPEITDVYGYQRKEGGNVQYSSKPNY